MTRRLVAPCVYPRCDDGHGDPELTGDGICDSCRRRYRRLLGWLAEDYVAVKTMMPAPVRPAAGGRYVAASRRSYGHPAEWASDTAALIAYVLGWVEDGLRDTLGDEPPPHPRTVEAHRVEHALAYLTARFDALCVYPAALDTAVELVDLHALVRRSLGLTRFVQRLPTPCPDCGTAALLRSVGQIECGQCATVIREEHYPFLTRVVIDDLIRNYDDTHKITPPTLARA